MITNAKKKLKRVQLPQFTKKIIRKLKNKAK